MASNKTPNLNLDIWAETDYFKRAELNSNFSKLDDNVNNIFQTAAFKDNLPYFNVKDFKLASDTDYTEAFKKALKNSNSVAFFTQILIPKSSTPYKISGQITLKDNVNIIFERGAVVEYTGTADSMFTNDPTAASLFLRVTGGGRFLVNDKKIFNFRYSRSQTYGFGMFIDNVRFQSNDYTRKGTAISVGYTDFLHVQNCNFNYLDKAIEIYAYEGESRGNTQMNLDNISMYEVKTGVEFNKIDKGVFKSVDVAHCDIGFLGHNQNMLVKFIDCHVEYYESYAYKYDGSTNINNSFDNCSCFLPASTALGGFYAPQLAWASAAGQNHFSFNNCDFTKASQVSITGYVPFYCPSPFEWRGIDFEHVNAQKVNNDYPPGGCKIYPTLSRANGTNMLEVCNLNDTSLFHTVNGTMTIASDSTYYNGVKLTWNATSNAASYVKTKSLNVGWHTLVLKASQIGDPNVSLIVLKPTFGILFYQNIAELSYDARQAVVPRKTGLKTQTLTVPFYVDTPGTYYVGFYAPSTTTFNIAMNGIQLKTGFVTDYVEHERVWNKTSVPTSGYWYKGDKVMNPNASAVGDKIGWICTASGSPGTWMSLGTLSAP